MVTVESCSGGSSMVWATFRLTLLPREHDPVSASNLNAEQPMVDMHSDVQCSSDLKNEENFDLVKLHSQT